LLLSHQQVRQRDDDLADERILREVDIVDDLDGDHRGVLVVDEELVAALPGSAEETGQEQMHVSFRAEGKGRARKRESKGTNGERVCLKAEVW
jgi:hypothetical protein